MAVNINTVYQRVLAIANKEQNGYITPQEFNTFANQAQMEIFEQYFYDINQFGRLHGNSTEYSDMLDVLNEKLVPFQRTQQSSITESNVPAYLATYGSDLVTNGTFNTTINDWTAGVDADNSGGTQSFDAASQSIKLINDAAGLVFKSIQSVTTEAGKLYRVKAFINAGRLNTTGTNANAKAHVTFNGVSSVKINAGFSNTIEYFVSATSNSTNIELVITSTTDNSADFALFDNVEVKEVSGRALQISTTPSVYESGSQVLYRLGSVMYSDSNGRFVELSNVLPNDMLQINSSPLTKPTTANPVYVHHLNTQHFGDPIISVYPSNISSTLSVNYTVEPAPCYWGYTVVNEKAMYDAPSSTNFSLHKSESVTLVNKILELAGISMQKPSLTQSALTRDNKEIQQEKL
jgi:hypothetical protein